MTDHVTVGYRTVSLRNRCPIAPANAVFVAYEEHASVMLPTGSALRLSGDGISSKGGWATQTMFASYLQLHLGADPSKAEWFVAAAGGVPAPHCGNGHPLSSPKDEAARPGGVDHSARGGETGTRGAAAGEAPPRSATVARVQMV